MTMIFIDLFTKGEKPTTTFVNWVLLLICLYFRKRQRSVMLILNKYWMELFYFLEQKVNKVFFSYRSFFEHHSLSLLWWRGRGLKNKRGFFYVKYITHSHTIQICWKRVDAFIEKTQKLSLQRQFLELEKEWNNALFHSHLFFVWKSHSQKKQHRNACS